MYDDPECPWENWIADRISASNDHWLTDLRSPTPFLPECRGSWPGIEEWLTQRLSEDYDAGLGLLEPAHCGEIVIAGHIDLWNNDRHGDVRVSSALVTPEKPALYCVRFRQLKIRTTSASIWKLTNRALN